MKTELVVRAELMSGTDIYVSIDDACTLTGWCRAVLYRRIVEDALPTQRIPGLSESDVTLGVSLQALPLGRQALYCARYPFLAATSIERAPAFQSLVDAVCAEA